NGHCPARSSAGPRRGRPGRLASRPRRERSISTRALRRDTFSSCFSLPETFERIFVRDRVCHLLMLAFVRPRHGWMDGAMEGRSSDSCACLSVCSRAPGFFRDNI
ncbi:hypothetical protein EJB05_11814, partial [Eragrostis curvula]